MNACETIVHGGPICGASASSAVTIGCIHEHIETGPICDYHRDRLDNQTITCPACYRGPDPHVCVMRGRVTA